MEIPIKMDDLGVPPFSETPIFAYIYKLRTVEVFCCCFPLEQISGG